MSQARIYSNLLHTWLTLYSLIYLFHLKINWDIHLKKKLSTRLGTDEKGHICVPHPAFPFFFFFFWAFCGCGESFSRSCALFTGPINLFFFNKIFIKNRSHDTIHTFKNYFTSTFSVFSKINGIQTDAEVSIGPLLSNHFGVIRLAKWKTCFPSKKKMKNMLRNLNQSFMAKNLYSLITILQLGPFGYRLYYWKLKTIKIKK